MIMFVVLCMHLESSYNTPRAALCFVLSCESCLKLVCD